MNVYYSHACASSALTSDAAGAAQRPLERAKDALSSSYIGMNSVGGIVDAVRQVLGAQWNA